MIYLFYGDEKYELYSEVEKIKKNFNKLEVGVNYFNITKENIDTLDSLYEMVNFFGENKLVIIKDAGFKFDTKKMLQLIDENDIYIIIEDSIDKRLASYKEISKVANVKEFNFLNEKEMSKYIIETLKKYGVVIDNSTADYMVSVCGIDKNNNINELKKLLAFINERKNITKEDIDKICSKTLSAKVFDMLDMAVLKKHEKAISMLKELINQKEPAIKISIMLYKQIKQMYMIKKIESIGKNDANSILKIHPFVYSKLQKACKNYTLEELKNIIYLFDEYDEKTKIGEMDFEIGLKKIILMM